MRAPGQVLLVSCYELGHQPLSLASPLAVLSQAGFQPRAIDTCLDPLDEAAVRQARLVAISAPMHTAMRLGQDMARRVRMLNPTAHVCFYGLYAWLNAEHLFEAGLADSVIGGEFEPPLLRLAEALDNQPPAGEPGAGARSRADGVPPIGELQGVRGPGREARPSLERHVWAPPRRDGLPDLARYAQFVREDRAVVAGYVEATRGCKHTCAHCPITPVYGGRFFAVPREVVLADIRAQVASGARHITFGDPDFLNGPSHSLRIARALHEELPNVTFDATIKIEHILQHAAVFPELAELGCAFVVSAVEALSDTVLAHLRKGHTAEDVDRALAVLADAGIPMRPSLLAFTPWTSLEDYLALLHFVRSRGLIDAVDPVQYGIRLLIPPGSAVLDDPTASEWLRELEPAALSYRWEHPDPCMDELQAQVSAIVEEGELERRDAWATFAAINAAAHRASGRTPAIVAVPPPDERRRPPRLTESWFC